MARSGVMFVPEPPLPSMMLWRQMLPRVSTTSTPLLPAPVKPVVGVAASDVTDNYYFWAQIKALEWSSKPLLVLLRRDSGDYRRRLVLWMTLLPDSQML